MKKNLKCPKCEGEMEEGFVYAYIGYVQNFMPAVTPSGFVGNVPLWWGKSDKDKLESPKDLTEDRYVKNFRCTKCGYVETYATDLYKKK